MTYNSILQTHLKEPYAFNSCQFVWQELKAYGSSIRGVIKDKRYITKSHREKSDRPSPPPSPPPPQGRISQWDHRGGPPCRSFFFSRTPPRRSPVRAVLRSHTPRRSPFRGVWWSHTPPPPSEIIATALDHFNCENNMIRRSVDYRQDLTNQIRLCKFLVGDTPKLIVSKAVQLFEQMCYLNNAKSK